MKGKTRVSRNLEFESFQKSISETHSTSVKIRNTAAPSADAVLSAQTDGVLLPERLAGTADRLVPLHHGREGADLWLKTGFG